MELSRTRLRCRRKSRLIIERRVKGHYEVHESPFATDYLFSRRHSSRPYASHLQKNFRVGAGGWGGNPGEQSLEWGEDACMAL